jgi:hypothetical protein
MMTEKEAIELLEVLRENNSEVPPINPRKLACAYVAILDARE